jgi:hypothetical protein
MVPPCTHINVPNVGAIKKNKRVVGWGIMGKTYLLY